jgi:hypothetical protein
VLVRPIDPARELEAAARLLAERWTLALPTAISAAVGAAIAFFAIGAIIVGVLGAYLAGGLQAALGALTTGALTFAVALAVIVVLSWIGHAVVVAAAHEAWAGREPDFSQALQLVLTRLPALLTAFVAIGVLALVPFLLCFVLIGIPLLLALGYLLMYVTPAIVIGGEDGLAAVRSSFRIAVHNGASSGIGYAGILGAFLLGRVADAMFVHIPLIGLVSAFVIGGLTAAYGSLVAVRFYELLRAVPRSDPQAALAPGS